MNPSSNASRAGGQGESISSAASWDSDVADRLLASRRITETGCWEWTRSRRNGYGHVWSGGRVWTVHRVAASLWLGLDYNDKSLDACHQCDNPPCFNPDHLFLGTRAENMRDMIAKGRKARGYQCPGLQRHPRERACDVCGTTYAPDADHRGRSKTCSSDCLSALRSVQGKASPPNSKLTREIADEIRRELASGRSGVDVARAYRVSTATVSLIRNRKAWA